MILEIFDAARAIISGFDPEGYFRRVGWERKAHDQAILEVGTFKDALAENRREYADFKNLQADPKGLRIEWFEKYKLAYEKALLNIRREARADLKVLEAQPFSAQVKKEIRRAMGI